MTIDCVRKPGDCLRLLVTPAAPGPWNMAVDQVLMSGLERAGTGAYLRFYRWDPPTLSFGRFQRPETIIDLERLPTSGIGAVRRASGGKMVFHADELTFAMGVPIARLRAVAPEARDFLGWFRAALLPLVDALCELGVPASFPAEENSERPRHSHQAGIRQVHCYAATIGHSLMAGGRKLVGAAGIERNGILAIHGSLPIAPVELPREIFRKPPETGVEQGMAFLQEWLSAEEVGRLPERTMERMKTRFGFPTAARVSLDTDETALVERLAAETFADLAWPDRHRDGTG